ncbi:hypothetical protein HYPSUDRAFT_174114 [Hypholoma sublateritium FD-334 SS-4]|uniref:Uncharacterized protein n=1 Tax=Hypholoma sublateritium (strain FD-334 SS-4) TaxID=945553 RepID=A0A0D2NXT8_HYPSF|nr:hypothetical protein HYPSUDRAFT_174114 [Hypholoma sublateritium FD-334 SS-4]
MQTTPKQFQLLHSSYEDMFQWQSSELKDFLPNIYQDLANYVDQLPGNDTNPAYPFAGFVLNLNVSTRLHRDRHDKDICLIVFVSECTGGALILYELGLVLDLDNGNGITFQSSKIMHCNMHFEGLRASFVFYTDRASDAWMVGQKGKGSVPNNGWANNIYFRKS